MIEKIIRDYLLEAVRVPVYTEVPKDPPSEYVLIERFGGSRRNTIETAMISVRSVGTSLMSAIEVDESVREAILDGIISRPDVYGTRLNACTNLTDTELKNYRYQSTFEVTY